MKKKKLYYGWILIVAVAISMGLSLSIANMFLSLFVVSVTKVMGITVTAFMVSSTVIKIVQAVAAPFAGRLADKKGARFMAITCGLLIASGYVLLGFSHNLPLLYVGYAIVSLGSISGGMIVTNAICARWFDKYLSLANGIANMGMGLTSAVLIPITIRIIANNGYNSGYFFLAGAAFVLIALISFIFIKNDPAELGLYPDGADGPIDESDKPVIKLTGMDLGEAMKTWDFWAISLSLAILGAVATMQTYNAALQSVGITPATVATVASVFSLIGIGAPILFGLLTDRLPTRLVIAVGAGCYAVCCYIVTTLTAASGMGKLCLFAVLFAFGASYWRPVYMKYLKQCFGIKNISSINGAIQTIQNIGAMIGPIVAGRLVDSSGSYHSSYLLFTGMLIVSGVMLMMVRVPAKVAQ